jgi:hypothetical protein
MDGSSVTSIQLRPCVHNAVTLERWLGTAARLRDDIDLKAQVSFDQNSRDLRDRQVNEIEPGGPKQGSLTAPLGAYNSHLLVRWKMALEIGLSVSDKLWLLLLRW